MSFSLDPDGIIDLISSICNVSREELADESNPRTFGLLKLIDVADINLNRIKYVWTSIWKIIS